MVRRQPKLLLLEDLPQRLPRVVAKLQQLHPSGSERVVQGGLGRASWLLCWVLQLSFDTHISIGSTQCASCWSTFVCTDVKHCCCCCGCWSSLYMPHAKSLLLLLVSWLCRWQAMPLLMGGC
jgi:hypothetical protein